ncbi:hypothetical protein C8R44DRAFT_882090 [Mycena epipterygia]|nr:hypothetical protein C8R44DRAFT_882090 [Mycena epipterygia]
MRLTPTPTLRPTLLLAALGLLAAVRAQDRTTEAGEATIQDPTEECVAYSYAPVVAAKANFPVIWQPITSVPTNDTVGRAKFLAMNSSIPNIPVKGTMAGDFSNFTPTYSATDPDCWWTFHQCVTPKLTGLNMDIANVPEPRTLGYGFDDGPNCSHNAFYDYLTEQNQKATMFFIGSNVLDWPLEAQRAVSDGHQICVRSLSPCPASSSLLPPSPSFPAHPSFRPPFIHSSIPRPYAASSYAAPTRRSSLLSPSSAYPPSPLVRASSRPHPSIGVPSRHIPLSSHPPTIHSFLRHAHLLLLSFLPALPHAFLRLPSSMPVLRLAPRALLRSAAVRPSFSSTVPCHPIPSTLPGSFSSFRPYSPFRSASFRRSVLSPPLTLLRAPIPHTPPTCSFPSFPPVPYPVPRNLTSPSSSSLVLVARPCHSHSPTPPPSLLPFPFPPSIPLACLPLAFAPAFVLRLRLLWMRPSSPSSFLSSYPFVHVPSSSSAPSAIVVPSSLSARSRVVASCPSSLFSSLRPIHLFARPRPLLSPVLRPSFRPFFLRPLLSLIPRPSSRVHRPATRTPFLSCAWRRCVRACGASGMRRARARAAAVGCGIRVPMRGCASASA